MATLARRERRRSRDQKETQEVEEADERKNREEAEDEGEGEEDHENGEKSEKGEKAGNPSFGPGVSRGPPEGEKSGGPATKICLTVPVTGGDRVFHSMRTKLTLEERGSCAHCSG